MEKAVVCMREDNVQCTSRPASGKYYIPAPPLQSTMSTPLQCSTLHPTLPAQSTIPTPAANMIENVQTLFQYRRRRIFKVLQQSYNLQTNKQTNKDRRPKSVPHRLLPGQRIHTHISQTCLPLNWRIGS